MPTINLCIRLLVLIKVFSAKVVTNARSPGAKCYGLVTMSSSAEVARCISHLDGTELHGQQISVDRVRTELQRRFVMRCFLPRL